MQTTQENWVFTIRGQQALLSVHTKLRSKKSNDIITLADIDTPLIATPAQASACADHLVHIDVLNEVKGCKKRSFTLLR